MCRPLYSTLIVLLLTAWPGALSGTVQGGDVHHELQISVDPATSSLVGIDTLRLPGDGKPLTFFLSKKAEIVDVVIGGLPTARYRFRDGRLTVFRPTTGGGTSSVTVKYRAVFDDPVPEAPAHHEDPSYGVSGAITERGVYLGSEAHWYPVLPGIPASFRIRIETPAGLAAVTSGRLVSRGQTGERAFSTWESTIPLESLTVVAGPYRIGERESSSASLHTYLYPANAHLSDTYLEATEGFLELFEDRFGPYPFSKFAVAENFFPTGYGFPSWTLLGSTVVRLPFIVETSLGHEIAHSWWGNGVQVDYARGNWAEGLTTYVADHLFKEMESERAGREYRLKILRDYTALVGPGEGYPLSRFTGRKTAADQAIGYGKCAMVFHMARRRLGDRAFWDGLRKLAATGMHREVAWSDFVTAWQSVSGIDLGPFFRQWVDRPGAPLLRIADMKAEERDGVWIVRGRLRQQAPYFALQVPLRLETAEEPVSLTVPLREAAAEFEIRSTAAPVRLTVDPEVDLFRRLHPEEMPPTVNTLRGSDHLLAIVSDTLPEAVLAPARDLLAALRQPGTRLVRERDVDREELEGRDLLFFGLPTDPALLPALPPRLRLSPREFTLDGTTYSETGAALFAALPHPIDPARRSALFFPLSDEAARQAVRKIPHYGKYSYLVFLSGDNRGKGTWAPSSSPLVHHFSPRENRP